MKYWTALLLVGLLAGCGSDGPTGPVTERERLARLLADARSCEEERIDSFSISLASLPVLASEADHNAVLSEAFIRAVKTQPCVFELPSGLVFRIDNAVSDETAGSPRAGEVVTVNFEGRHIDGSVFNSTFERNSPRTFVSNETIAGWIEALPMMRIGEVWTLYIPPALAYGELGTQGGLIEPNEALVFRLELVDYVSTDPVPASSAGDDNPQEPSQSDGR